MVGFYLYPTDTAAIESIAAAITQFPSSSELLVAVNLNMYLDGSEGVDWYEAILAALSVVYLEYMSANFLPLQTRNWDQDGRT